MDKPTLIYKVLSGGANDAERAELKAWIARDPNNAEEFEDIKLLYEGSLNIEEKISERDAHFYEGLRKIQDRIKVLKAESVAGRSYKRAAIVASISAVIAVLSICLFKWSEPPARQAHEVAHTIPLAVRVQDNLAFDNATLGSIFEMLQERYELEFKVVSEELLSCSFTGTFYRGLAVDELIRVLAESEQFSFRVIHPATYELQGKGCP